MSSAHKLKDSLRDSELVLFDGVGHLPYEETPEEFNRVLREFLLRKTRSVQSVEL